MATRLVVLVFGGETMLQLVLLCLIQSVTAFGPMSTISTMEGTYGNATDTRSPILGNYAICGLQATDFTPRCTAIVTYGNNTQAPENTSVYALTNGFYFTCGLRYEDRTAVCWGDINFPTDFSKTPYSEISAGGFHVCGIRMKGGFVDCWGDSNKNQTRPPRDKGFVSIASGRLFTCGLTEMFKVICWGDDISGGGSPPTRSFMAIFAGGYHACGLVEAGKALCWGGSAKYNETASPGDSFVTLSSGMYHTCGLKNGTREAICWGDNAFQQLQAPAGVSFSQLRAAGYYTCGVRIQDQGIQCWGNSIRSDTIDIQYKVAAGLCKGGACGSREHFVNKCPKASDNVCLENLVPVLLAPAASPAIKDPSSIPDPKTGRKSEEHIGLIVGAAAAATLFFMVASMLLLFILCKDRRQIRKATSWRTIENDLGSWQPSASRLIIYTAAELEVATLGYHENMVLGKGTYGTVYRGKLTGNQVVAIKRSCEPGMSSSFSNELELLARLHHTCLVNVLGFCKSEMLVVYEFMENGSLFDCLFKKTDVNLNWNTRLKIAVQAARGIEYLHVYASPPIIHRDVKSANILLDKDWNAHVADFGLSRGLSPLGPPLNRSYLSTTVTVVGTPGFVDPEYFQTSHLTTKSDVYSFGVVLLELVTGRKSIDEKRPGVGIVTWVSDLVQKEQGQRFLEEVVDPRIISGIDLDSVSRVLELALHCTKFDGRHRPAMTIVLSLLEEIRGGNSSGETSSISRTGSIFSVQSAR